jgi:hypothetical protein
MKEEIIEVMSKLQKKAIRYKSQKRLRMAFNDDEYYSYILFEYIRDLQSQLKAKEDLIKEALDKIETLRMEKWAIMGTDIMDIMKILSKGENK